MTDIAMETKLVRRFEFKRHTPYGTITIPISISISETLVHADPFYAAMTAMQMVHDAETAAVEEKRKALGEARA